MLKIEPQNTFGGFRFDGRLKEEDGKDIDCMADSYYDGPYGGYLDIRAWSKVYGEYNAILRTIAKNRNQRYKFALEIDIANFL